MRTKSSNPSNEESKSNHMSTLDKFRDSSKSLSAAIKTKFEKQSSGGDQRFWNVSRAEDGTGSAIIRFLPYVNKNDEPGTFESVYQYQFTGPNGLKYNEKSPTTIGKPDPVQEHWANLWSSGNKVEAKKFTRGQMFYANILVVKDTAKPENTGKVKIYRFGKTIADMIKDAEKARDDGGYPIQPFYLWSWSRSASDQERLKYIEKFGNPGANFVVRVKTKGDKFPSYEASSFQEPSCVGEDDYISTILEQTYDLSEFVDPETFKSYAELKRLFDEAMDNGNSSNNNSETRSHLREDIAANSKSNKSKSSGTSDGDDLDDAALEELINSTS